MSEIDAQAFLDWLDDQDGYSVAYERVDEQYPNFPWGNIVGATVILGENGERMYLKRDLRQAVTKGYITD